MTIAVLPFNAGPDAPPALARQLANFPCDIVKNHTGAEVNAVNYLVRLDDGPAPRFANVNASEALNEFEMLGQFFEQAGAGAVLDGLLTKSGDSLKLEVRFTQKGAESAGPVQTFEFTEDTALPAVRGLVESLAGFAGVELPAETKDDLELFGTDNSAAFVKFLQSYDALKYINDTQGQVAIEFSPEQAMTALIEAVDLDKDWEAPAITLVQLCRACTQFQVGTAEMVEGALKGLIAKVPDDGRAVFALGELYQALGNHEGAVNQFERAAQLEPEEPAILTRLGISQMQMGMPVNAERNFKKAIEMEGDEKPSMDFLAQVLQGTGRGHEVPALWKALIDQNPQNGQAHVKYAISLVQTGQQEEGQRAFDVALETLEDNTLVKRYYAPLLKEKKEFDRAMDFYEDCLEVAPNDIPVLIEYAQTLQEAERAFEVPKVLRDVLASNPDPNTRAQTLAWLTELEQPKRVEAVQNAQTKMEAGDFAGAVKELRPLRNWLADYWKMWALLASALNRTEEHTEAEEAAKTLINLFPGCEPAYAEVATALSAQEKHEEAYNAMRFGLQQVPNSLPIVLNLGLASKRLGRFDEARAIARQIREAVGQNDQLEEVLAEIERP